MNKEIWVFGADKSFSTVSKDVESRIQQFSNSWNTHGAPVHPTVEFLEERFVKVVSNAGAPISGCSKDTLFQFVQSLGSNLGVSFLERGLVFFKMGNGPITALNFTKLDELHLEDDSLRVFDLTVGTEKAFLEKWCVKGIDSWVSKIPR